MSIYACEIHCDRALDDALENTEAPPDMEKINDESLSTSCSFCEEKAVYKIS